MVKCNNNYVCEDDAVTQDLKGNHPQNVDIQIKRIFSKLFGT